MKRNQAIVLVLVVAAAALTGPRHAAALWSAIAPSSVATDCPVIVTGEIVKIDRAAAKVLDRVDRKYTRVLDVAHIRISQVNKNLLIGVSTKVGRTITARMHSKKDPIRISLDLYYKIGTKALWMLYLEDDGHFYINRRPEQHQPVGSYDKIKGQVDVVRGKPIKPGELPSQIYTVKEWITARRQGRRAETEEAKRHKALLADACKAVAGIYDHEKLQEARLPSLIDQRTKVRSELANMSARRMGVSQADWVVVRCYLARHDPVANHRSRAMPGWVKGSALARTLLLDAIRDESWEVRLFACQALGHADDKTVADKVTPLLDDPNRWVRKVAVRTLGRLGAKRHAPAILALYRKTQDKTEAEIMCFGVALAKLGRTEVPLACWPKAMASKNWNIRWMAMGIIQTCESPTIVPAIMAELPGELVHAFREYRQSKIGDRVLVAMTAELAKRTEQEYGLDVSAWMTWWSDMAPKYGVAPPTQAQIAETKRVQTEYYRLLKRKVTPK